MSYSSRVYRQRNAHTHDDMQQQPFFARQNDTNKTSQKNAFFQAKLTIGNPGDKYEQEADAVANTVVNRQSNASPVLQHKKISSIQRMEVDPEKDKLKNIQKMDDPLKEDDEKKNPQVQTKQDGNSATSPQLSSKIENSSGKGNALPAKTLSTMNRSFGVDFSNVRVHKDSEAAILNKELRAQAFTHKSDIYFNEGKYNPENEAGKLLLAHELTHVVQQESDVIHKKGLGSKFSHGSVKTNPYKIISALFDGRDFHLFGDSTELMKVPAESGRPYSVKDKDAKDCKGSTTDSYKNNPRYVGIKDNGPIPEGTYRFSASQMAIFSATEQLEMISGGSYTDPFGTPLHGGDWGSGRVALTPVNILPGPKGCGDTSKRSGFYLHGGSLPGSSGCIDTGNAAIDQMVKYIQGYKGTITVKVSYKFPPPAVGTLERTLGRVTYPGQENPTVWDRIKAGISGD